MNQKAYIKHWIRGIHMPNYESVVFAKKLLLNRRLWSWIGIVTLALGFILLVVWAAETGGVTINEGTGSSYPNPLSGP